MTQNSPTPQWKSLIGCLGRRVLTLAFILLVIPLLIHASLLYKQARHHAQIDNLNNLALLARTESSYIKLFMAQTLADIQTVEILGSYTHRVLNKLDSASFSKIAYEQSLTSLFVAEKKLSDTWTILAAAHQERLDDHDLDPDEYNKILALGTAFYLYKDELVGKKELRIGYALGDHRVMIMGMPLEGVANALVRAPTIKVTPIVAFTTSDTDLYYASDPGFELSTCKLLAPEEFFDLQQSSSGHFNLAKADQFIGVTIPVTGNAFYLVIALSKEHFLAVSSQTSFNHILQLMLLFVVIGGGGVFFLTARIARPLKQLFGCLDQVGEGDLTVRYQADPVGFELNILGDKFNQMLTSLELNIEEVKKEKLAKELLKQELRIGEEIQKAILRTSMTGAGSFVFTPAFKPAMEVSGDYYDVYKIDESQVLLVVADTAGKGISACLYSLGARSVLRALTKSGLSLDKILIQMNQLILEDVETQGAFITAFIAILDRSNSSLVYANCGHPPAYLLTKQGIEPLPSKGMALGVDQEFKFDLQTITLAAQDKVFIYTDGVIEAHNAQNEMYSLDRLELFLNTYKDQTGAALIDTLQKDLDLFCDKTDLHDDLTMLCIEKKG